MKKTILTLYAISCLLSAWWVYHLYQDKPFKYVRTGETTKREGSFRMEYNYPFEYHSQLLPVDTDSIKFKLN